MSIYHHESIFIPKFPEQNSLNIRILLNNKAKIPRSLIKKRQHRLKIYKEKTGLL